MAKTSALYLGILTFLGGVFSFIPNPVIGSGAFFASNYTTGVIALVAGAILIFAEHGEEKKLKKTLKVMSIIAFILALISFLTDAGVGSGTIIGLSFNNADSWLILIVGIFLLWLSEKNEALPAKV